MKCLKCGNSEFNLENTNFKITVKNEALVVAMQTRCCKKCSTPLLNDEHITDLRRAAADQYRKERGLLTSSQIVNHRKKLQFSQKDFAEYLGVGEASVKRWETYYIQDASQDELIRLKCDYSYAREHLAYLKGYHSDPDIYNGMKSFSFPHFKNSVLYFIRQFKTGNMISLPKLQFYADFFHYKQHKKSITGSTYRSLKIGPYPESCSYRVLIEGKYVKQIASDTYRAQDIADMDLFDEGEKHSLEYVCKCAQDRCLAKLSQLEKGFLDCDNIGRISYAHANSLLI